MAWTERYVRADAAGGGDGTTDTNSGANGAFTLAEAITHSATNTGIRYNIRGAAGTFANTTTTRTFNGVGTTTAPNWWRGFNTAIGDLDNVINGAYPSITFTTGQMVISGAHQIFTCLNISGANTGGSQVSISGGNVKLDQFRIQNTGANAASTGLGIGGSGVLVSRGWVKATATASIVLSVSGTADIEDVSVEGGGVGINMTSTCVVNRCNIYDVGSHGVNMNGAFTMVIRECNIYSAGGDGIHLQAIPGALSKVSDCVINDSAAWGINNATGTNTNVMGRLNNLFYNNASGIETGFGDSPSLSQATDSASSFNNAAGKDLTLASTSNGRNTGLPTTFENFTTVSYADRGAARHQDPSGGTVALPVVGTIF